MHCHLLEVHLSSFILAPLQLFTQGTASPTTQVEQHWSWLQWLFFGGCPSSSSLGKGAHDLRRRGRLVVPGESAGWGASSDEQGESPTMLGGLGATGLLLSFYPLPLHRQMSPEKTSVFFLLLSHLSAVISRGLVEEKTSYTAFVLKEISCLHSFFGLLTCHTVCHSIIIFA